MIVAESNIAFETVGTILFVFYARLMIYEANSPVLYSLGGLRFAGGYNDFFPD